MRKSSSPSTSKFTSFSISTIFNFTLAWYLLHIACEILVRTNFSVQNTCPKFFPPKLKKLSEIFSAEVFPPKLFPTKVFAVNVYLKIMQGLAISNPWLYEQFSVNKLFSVRRSDRFRASLWTELTIEQVSMRSIKNRGGLTRGRGSSFDMVT